MFHLNKKILTIACISLLHSTLGFTILATKGREQIRICLSSTNSGIPDMRQKMVLPPIRKERERKFRARKQEWINKSLTYYSKVLRDQSLVEKYGLDVLLREDGALPLEKIEPQQRKVMKRASEHYFAVQKIKNGELEHAEKIYRNAINEILNEREHDGECDHASLAVTTLLLALLKQRQGDIQGTRSVFLNFFKHAVVNGEVSEGCACSAKVLQAYALFEMKRGNPTKSLEIVKVAVSMDQALSPVLQWKLFRDAEQMRMLIQ